MRKLKRQPTRTRADIKNFAAGLRPVTQMCVSHFLIHPAELNGIQLVIQRRARVVARDFWHVSISFVHQCFPLVAIRYRECLRFANWLTIPRRGLSDT